LKIEKKVGTVAIVFIDERDYAFLIRALLGYVSFWLILIFLFATQISWAAMQPLPDAVLGSFALWTPWILVSPLMLLMGYLLPPGGVGIWKFIVGHVVACSVLLAAASALAHLLPPPPGEAGAPLGPTDEMMENDAFPPSLRPPITLEERHDRRLPPPHDNLMPTLEHTLPVGLPLYVSAVLLVGSIKLRRFSLEKERQAQELETQLTTARLQALQLQLQPHFLFNTLNTLTSLVHTDPAKAEEVLLCLSNLLRATLETKDKNLIPFRQELDLVRSYLTVQRARYGARLKVEETIPLDTLACSVPPLLLLPMVENAIKHAVEPHADGATIRLRSERMAESLVVEVEDSGAGRSTATTSGHGVGVANTRGRLAATYPNRKVGFDLIPNHHGGITARFEMPAVAG